MSGTPRVAVVGAGPAGLMAAEQVATAGVRVDVFEAMPSPGRKLLMAGRGGLNLTHTEPLADFLGRYRERREEMRHLLQGFGPTEQVAWVEALGVPTFAGSSGRVFPRVMKAAPLLRAWLARLAAQGARLHRRHRWTGWGADGRPRFETPDGVVGVDCDALVLATGGASWPRLGADGGWTASLAARGIGLAALRPANCGFDVAWSEHLRDRFAGSPLKPVTLALPGRTPSGPGECVVTRHGIEGGLVYAFSAALRNTIERDGAARLHLDLAPARSTADLARALATPRGRRSLAEHLRRRTRLAGVKAALLRECLPRADLDHPERLAAGIKALPLELLRPRPVAEAISTAGGVRFEALDERLMLRSLPGVFCCGEMLDWEAPTGGYLLTGCFASGRVAGMGVVRWLAGGGAGA